MQLGQCVSFTIPKQYRIFAVKSRKKIYHRIFHVFLQVIYFRNALNENDKCIIEKALENELNHCVQSYYNCLDVNCIIDAAEAVDAFSNNSYYTEWQLRCCLGPDSHKQTKYTNLGKLSIFFLLPITNLSILLNHSLCASDIYKYNLH